MIGQASIDRVFHKLGSLMARLDRNNWNDRIVGRFSKNAKVDEDYEPVKEEDD